MREMMDLHDRAMAAADEADAAAARGAAADALRLYTAAFDLDRAAADLTASRPDLEPTRAILHRSAASLALQIKAFRACERLVGRALAGDPPADIAAELRDLWDQSASALRGPPTAMAQQ